MDIDGYAKSTKRVQSSLPGTCSSPPVASRIHQMADTGNACKSGATEITRSPE